MEKREQYLDYLRVLSCLAVIMTHVFVTARTDFINHSLLEEFLSLAIADCLHFAVPIFFMITGALFLSKKKSFSMKSFLKKYVCKYLVAIFTFGWAYAIIEEIFKKNIDLLLPLRSLLNTIQGNTWDHLWYLYTLVGVMLIIPIVKYIVDNNEELLKYFFIILITSSFLFPLIEAIFSIKIGFIIPIISECLTYTLVGYYIEKNTKKVHNMYWILAIITSLIIIIISSILVIYYSIKPLDFIGNYNSLIILFLSVSIFEIFKNNKFTFMNKVINYISPNTYGIYLIHMFWINIMYKLIKFNIYGDFIYVKVLIVFFITFILSLISTKIIKQIPLLKKIV